MNKWKQRYRHWRQLVRLAAAARTLRTTTSAAIGKAAQLWGLDEDSDQEVVARAVTDSSETEARQASVFGGARL